MSDSHTLGATYEKLLRYAYGGKQTNKNGAYARIMGNLIDKEQGKANVAQQADASIQLEKVKSHILMALDKFLTWKMSQSHRDSLEGLKKRTRSARSSTELLEICELAFLMVDPNV